MRNGTANHLIQLSPSQTRRGENLKRRVMKVRLTVSHRRDQKKIRIKLADGKERTIQHMMATTFWSPDGKPISAAQFVEKLFGELPRFFKDEDELRRIWSRTSSLLRSSLSFWYTHGYRRRNEKIPCDRTMLRLL
jgi:hypothetical protein